jgi:tRNA threonylcarbamoyladenosine biosynthesis protein TsaB
MRILALDTTSTAASVAICEDEKIIGSYRIATVKKHSETLLPMIEHLCKVTATSLSQIDAFAVTVGPGSFTGVRIGVSTVKGLAFGSDRPCIAVSTLESLAWNLKGTAAIVVSVMDARRNQFYNAIFENDGQVCRRLTPDRLISAKELANELLQYQDKPIYFVGDGYDLARKTVSDAVCVTPPILRMQNAESIALLAKMQLTENRNIFTDRTLSPDYLRPSQAERERAEKNMQ